MAWTGFETKRVTAVVYYDQKYNQDRFIFLKPNKPNTLCVSIVKGQFVRL